MISSSIHAEMPQNFFKNLRTGWPFFSATSLQPFSLRRVSTSAPVNPVSGLTLSDASVSGTDADAISGGLVSAGMAGDRLASEFFAAICMVDTFFVIGLDQSDAASCMILTIVFSTSCATPFSCGVLNIASSAVGFNEARMVLPPSS